MTKNSIFSRSLRDSTALSALLLGAGFAFAVPAAAQSTTPAQPTPSTQTSSDAPLDEDKTDNATTGNDVVITGTLFKVNNTPSPVTTVTTDQLDRRGISTIENALQSLASNNGPALTNNFSANGAFAAGASAVSLRGLSTSSTLVLFDGLRAAYYPLADDGTRNFVDLNTIPDDIVERIEVLRDGASSSYGADAIAGVVNIITKRQVKGLNVRAETGISQRGDGAQYRIAVTGGVGDIDRDGYNAYLSGFYYKSEMLRNNDRPFPYNTTDYRTICSNRTGTTVCGNNGIINGVATNGTFTLSTGANFLVRPSTLNAAGQPVAVAGSRYQALNGDCGPGDSYTLTDAQFTVLNAQGVNTQIAPRNVCQYDRRKIFGVINPRIERFGASAKITAKLGDSIEAYGEVNFLQSNVFFTARAPQAFRAGANTGILYPTFSTASGAVPPNAVGSFVLYLPVFVCPQRVNCATAANRQANPNNPFANAGQVAALIGVDNNPDKVPTNESRTRAFRGAFGVSGDITDRIGFNVTGTAMHIDLRQIYKNYIYIQRLLDVINDGTYNFLNPNANSAAVENYLRPTNINNNTSDQYQIQGTLTGKITDLPGGPLELAVGVSERYEAVDSPSANDDYNGPTQRYFTLNAFGTKGSRYIFSAFGELNAPILDQVTVNLSGRYDKYSTGQSSFSPKAGVTIKPIQQVLLRGTYSRGFRIPSFAESNALPTTGFVANTAPLFSNAFLAQYTVPNQPLVCNTTNFNTAACPLYINGASFGQTTLASPNLKPEKSRSFTAGLEIRPIPRVTISVDYYNIRKSGAIIQPSNTPALQAYYANQAIPAGYTVIPNAPDPNFPTARPTVAFVQSALINASTVKVEGLDFSIDANFNITPDIKFSTTLDASLLLNLSTDFPAMNGAPAFSERYDGTLGNFNLTSGSGTPKWHGSWLASLDFGQFRISNTVNYFGGYDKSAMDQGTGYKDCGLAPGYVECRTPAYITDDVNVSFRVNDKFTFFMNVINVADKLPPFDPVATYGIQPYNQVQGGTGILGRYFKAGVKVGL